MTIRRFTPNPLGRDFIVGDIHGAFSRLDEVLTAGGFDKLRDRLFSVGDLVDRGPESEMAAKWLAEPWFFAVRGNHEDMAIRWAKNGSTGMIDMPLFPMDSGNYYLNGGEWMLRASPAEQKFYGQALADGTQNLAFEIETHSGKLIGVVHAECPWKSWAELRGLLSPDPNPRWFAQAYEAVMWTRDRIEEQDRTPVHGIDMIVCGHTPVTHPIRLGNHYFIETRGWHPRGFFTVVNVEDL